MKATTTAPFNGKQQVYDRCEHVLFFSNFILHAFYMINQQEGLFGSKIKDGSERVGGEAVVGGIEDTGNGVRNAGHC